MVRTRSPRRCGRLRRHTGFGVFVAVLAAVLVGPASAAAADDIYEIDGRLTDAGFEAAYTEAFDAADRPGVRVVVDYASASTSAADYQRESEEIAELVWDHLDGRVLAVDIAPIYGVAWSPNGLPPAVSFDRASLTARFGERPAVLDRADLETVQDAGDDFAVLAGLAVTGWALSVVAGVAITFVVTRSRYRQASTWTGPLTWPATWPPVPPGAVAPGAAHEPTAWSAGQGDPRPGSGTTVASAGRIGDAAAGPDRNPWQPLS